LTATITAIGNEGFRVEAAGIRVFVDAFYASGLGVGSAPCLQAQDLGRDDLILVTHAHGDHFDPEQVSALAEAADATVVGPATVIQALRRYRPTSSLVTLEPPTASRGAPARSLTITLPHAKVKALRTFHSQDHNSYLLDLDGFRLFHDGDNEDTRRISPAEIGPLDALFIGPWQGSGWAECVEKLAPRKWFLMHLTEAELDQQEAGTFLTDLCDHVPLPERLVVLRPGQSFCM
jgi:L-ascorbate metabolism protein UlaG (beta-lactamase superfamily)